MLELSINTRQKIRITLNPTKYDGTTPAEIYQPIRVNVLWGSSTYDTSVTGENAVYLISSDTSDLTLYEILIDVGLFPTELNLGASTLSMLVLLAVEGFGSENLHPVAGQPEEAIYASGEEGGGGKPPT